VAELSARPLHPTVAAAIEAARTAGAIPLVETRHTRVGRELLRDINQELVRVNAGVYVYRIEPVEDVSPVQHLYPEGRIPALTNAHTRADVTGFAVLQDRPYQHTLVYVGIAAHKTSVESLWASLIRGKGRCSGRQTSRR
jgi:hypothetical protein